MYCINVELIIYVIVVRSWLNTVAKQTGEQSVGGSLLIFCPLLLVMAHTAFSETGSVIYEICDFDAKRVAIAP